LHKSLDREPTMYIDSFAATKTYIVKYECIRRLYRAMSWLCKLYCLVQVGCLLHIAMLTQ
jgi:hypothetical protein